MKFKRSSKVSFDAEMDHGKKASSYRKLLQVFLDTGLKPVLFKDYAADISKKNILLLRHDVDSDLDAALNLALIDHQMGIKSTFYFLPPGDYNKTSNYYGRILFGKIWHKYKFSKAIKTIQSYGHEIGIHNDFVQLSFITKRTIESLIRDEIKWFKSKGITIYGTASHGSEFAKKYNFINYEIFSSCKRKNFEANRKIVIEKFNVPLNALNFNDFDLCYEAYHLPRTHSYSDSSNKIIFTGPNSLKYEVKNLSTNLKYKNFYIDLKLALESQSSCVISILIHPEWWN